MAISRLFSSASAMASFMDSMSLPFCINGSTRVVLLRFGAGTLRGKYGPIGLGKWERGLV